MRRITGRIRRMWATALYASGLPAAVDRWIGRRALRGPRDRARVGALVVCPPGDGNVGDQALFEAYLENVPGPVTAVVRYTDDVRIPGADEERVTVVAMPDLVYGRGRAHLGAFAAFARAAAGVASVAVIGADLMDGKYSVRGSVRRSLIAEIAARAGADSRILGFSWNAAPRTSARRALVAAARSGAVPYLRDPLSAERARRNGVPRVELSADLVFSGTAREPAPVRPSIPYAVLNVSGLIARSGDHTSEYVRIVRGLHERGLNVVVLPHVVKALSDDLAAATAVLDTLPLPDAARVAAAASVADTASVADAARVADAPAVPDPADSRPPAPSVSLVRTLPTPGQVRDLVADAAVVVTGRMHLAILALRMGTPAVALATQGKVEGLMTMFGAPELCVTPTAGFGDRVLGVIETALSADAPLRTTIAAALPAAVELSRRNLRDLAVVPAGGGSE